MWDNYFQFQVHGNKSFDPDNPENMQWVYTEVIWMGFVSLDE